MSKLRKDIFQELFFNKNLLNKENIIDVINKVKTITTNDFNKFYKQKKSSNYNIYENIIKKEFKADSEHKKFYKSHFEAILITLNRIENKILNISDKEYIKIKYFLETLFDDICNFLNRFYFYKTDKRIYGLSKTTIVDSHKVFNHSLNMCYSSEFIFNDLYNMPNGVSIFLIRQSIELRIKNAFGIALIKSNNEIVKIPGDKILNYIKETDENIKFPIPISIIKKTYEWSNYYIHGGIIPYIWELEWSLNILTPLFSSNEIIDKQKSLKKWDAFGSIVMTEDYYNSIRKKIIDSFNKQNVVIQDLNKPEAIILNKFN